ncbi:MAG: heme-binding protein [Phycisphaerales bacterium JB040]
MLRRTLAVVSLPLLFVVSCGRPGGERAASEPPPPENPRAAEGITTLPGFQAEVLYEVPRDEQGSWVSLCAGPDGTLLASAQYGSVYRITPPPVGDFETEPVVERLPVEIGSAQGLCWAFDSLYAMVSGVGLHRVTDTDGDGELDAVSLILPLEGSGEHGPHAVVAHPDGESLLIVNGNHTALPELTGSRAPQVWDEDLLLERAWDANGHAVGVMAPGGVVLRVSPDGERVELISNGYRNAYDLAVSPEGEIFTYDSDMEWDLGMPWYRPTRVNHVTGGSEFGWRSGSGKWPEHYPDSLPAVVDIGPGSPTGVVFGAGAEFPAPYQRALYLCDWTFGTMYALTLTPAGASFTGQVEEFLSGTGLPLTDVVIGDDGAMYFTTGGRGTQSHLYRVWYYGVRDTASAGSGRIVTPEATLRRELEALQGRELSGEDLDAPWDALDHTDRHVRFAARVTLEHQPLDSLLSRLGSIRTPDGRIQGAIAGVRSGAEPGVVLGVLGDIDLDTLDTRQRLDWLRAVSLAWIRGGANVPADDPLRTEWRERTRAMFPHDDPSTDAELARLLVYFGSPGVVGTLLDAMEDAETPPAPDWAGVIARNDSYGGPIRRWMDNPTPAYGLHYAFLLRTVADGWTEADRERYVRWLSEARNASGGASYRGFIDRMIERSLQDADTPVRLRMLALAESIRLANETRPKVVRPVGPGTEWTGGGATLVLQDRMTGRDFERGAGLYQAIRCVECHRFDGYGGSTGPDLTSVAGRFGLEDLVRAIVEPSDVVSDQYAWSSVALEGGGVVVGRVVEEREDSVTLIVDAYDPGKTRTIARSDIESIEPSPISPMPAGQVNELSADELADLVAYLLSGGDENHELFE